MSVQCPASTGHATVHACAFFDSDDAEREAMIPFARECVQCGERCLGFVDPARLQERLHHLAAAGLAVPALQATGQLDLQAWQQSVLRDGSFDMQRMLAQFDGLAATPPAPFAGTRLWNNMEWVLDGAPGTERLVEFESRVNEVLRGHQGVVAICVYDLRRHGAPLLADILSTHPMLLVRGMLRANPMYVPTPQFLPEYAARHAASA